MGSSRRGIKRRREFFAFETRKTTIARHMLSTYNVAVPTPIALMLIPAATFP